MKRVQGSRNRWIGCVSAQSIKTAAQQMASAARLSGRMLHHQVEPPLTRNAFQLDDTAIAETEFGTRDQVLDRARDQHFAWLGGGSDSGADMDRDPANFAIDHLAFASVEPGADVESQVLDGSRDCGRAADRSRRAVEACKEAIAGRVDLATTEPRELAPD